jgi:hypothetical protein
MNTNARAASTGPLAAVIVDRGRAGGGAGDVVGRLFGRLSVLPALVLTAWLLAGLPLLLAGQFRPALMFAVSVPLAVVLVVFGLRWIPDRWAGALPARQPEHVRTPWWALAGVVAVAVAFGVDQMIYHSQFIIITRDPGSYFQFGYWIAHHGSLPIPQDRAAFGGTHGVLSFGSPAFYQDGTAIVPQFMAGLPMILAPAFWIGGTGAALLMAPALGACAVLTFGGLAARLVGPRWAPLAALVLALCLPEQFTSRSTYSEPLTEILLLGGLCLVVDSFETDGIGSRVTAGLGGLLLGLTVLGRIDGASDILPVIPYCGLLLIGRRRQALPLLGGLLVGAAYGCVDGLVLSRPYLANIRSSLVPLLLAAGAVTLATAVAVALLRRRGLPTVRRKWLPNAVALLTFVVMIGFAVRPYLQTVRAKSTSGTAGTVAAAQRASHLPIDPDRLYYEISLHWVFWYIGVPAVVLGTLAAALLSRRCLRGYAPTWTLPLITFAWATVTFLYRPAITPDQPWASRRLVPAVLPGLLLLAVWGSSWLVGLLRQRGLGPLARGGFAWCCAAALVLPAAATTFGLGIGHGGPMGIRLTADGLAFKTTYRGEIAAVDRMCARIPSRSSVVIIDPRIARRLPEVIRGMCGQPVARLLHPRPSSVDEVVRGIMRAGRRPVLLAARPSQLAPYGGPMEQIMALQTRKDESTLTTAPLNTWLYTLDVWMSQPGR